MYSQSLLPLLIGPYVKRQEIDQHILINSAPIQPDVHGYSPDFDRRSFLNSSVLVLADAMISDARDDLRQYKVTEL